jgi:hypothetical protein
VGWAGRDLLPDSDHALQSPHPVLSAAEVLKGLLGRGSPFRTRISNARAERADGSGPCEPSYHVMFHPGAGLERGGESYGTSGTLTGVELSGGDEMAARAAVWAQVRAAYQGGANLSELARSSGLSRTAIRTRARVEGWTRPDAEQEPVPCPAETKSRPTDAVHPPLDSLPDERHAVIRQHRREWRDLDRLRREAVRAASAPTPLLPIRALKEPIG